jgi:ribosomal-protein-alanine N-acetyltransferase
VDKSSLFSNLPQLGTTRLILRPLRLADAADVLAYAGDPEVSRFMSWEMHRSIDDSQDFLLWVMECYSHHEEGPWGLEERSSGRLIGTCGLHDVVPADRRAELGYTLARPYWNQGYMTEAVEAVLKFAFLRLDLNRIQAVCVPENLASERVMQKVGMTYEGTLRDYRLIKGMLRRMKMHSILRREYERRVMKQCDNEVRVL